MESLAPASEIMVIGEEMEPSTPVSGGGVGGGGGNSWCESRIANAVLVSIPFEADVSGPSLEPITSDAEVPI